MPIWSYEARSGDGELITGRVQAAGREVVLADLRGRGLSPVRVDQTRAPLFQQRVGTTALSSMFRGMSDLVASGVPLLRSLQLLAKGRAHQNLSTVLIDIADQVADGTAMAAAMTSHPNAFSSVHVAMVRAGEQGGFLAEVLVDLADLLERQATLRSRVIGNLIYPAILVVTGVGAVAYALVAFVPKFKPFFARIEVPAATRLLLGLSDFIVSWWLLVLIATVVLIGVAMTLRGRPGTRLVLGAAALRIPVVNTLVRDLSMARFGRLFGTLLGSGVGVLPALGIARAAAGQPQLEDAISGAEEAIRSGESMSERLGSTGVMSEEVVEMIAIAEAANALPRVMLKIADAAERRVDRRMDLLLRLMEPILLLGVAGMVVFIFAALVLPMMRMSSAIG
ncbi:MAG: type II secretion system F family protein [Phycisphaerales bacterium]|jgi:general secretion pathway protein F/type IV pilus assembly protein PilC|nr:pilus assembly protein PilC [Planctomycetaceae bacterium]MDP6157271.1 type II secretion system F family protein [Phycisphaerales bacterium]MDP6310579.1 type II secretion system F family protein [Phycisphaerales bacterium]MDP7086862.1 type II secretion system F family protein [Phycisphaerales bacterium]MDP7188777.1 type II secretion system F family protein [Phycisphaerales bacterium]|tara:strand:+ start:2828 stop:4012 length:1185 start_codon:yes stop_codon:yes gene_type:complete